MCANHAVVIGASGLIGWGIVDELLSADCIAPGVFKRVTALVNRPVKADEMFWPETQAQLPKLLVVDGVNLMDEQEQVRALLRDRIPDAETITNAFYFVFRADDGGEKEVALNVGMMSRFINALVHLAPNLQFIVFPGGTRGYGIYQPGGIFQAPLYESLSSSLPLAYAKTVAYPSFRALLTTASAGAGWRWCEVCPDTVVGFAPHGSGWSLAGHWAVYLSLWRLVHGDGAEVPFPGTPEGYDARFTEASTRTVARVAIHVATAVWRSEGEGEGEAEDADGSGGGGGGGMLFNVADCETPGAMRQRWPLIAAWFGLKGVPPPSEGYRGDRPGVFISKHRNLLESAGVRGVEVWHTEQLDNYGYWLDFDRHLGLGRLRQEAGFTEQSRPEDGWYRAFELFRTAGMIP